METRTRLENKGMAAIVIGVGIMLLGLAVAYFGGAFAPKPELVDRAALGWMTALIVVGVVFNLYGLAALRLARPSEREPYYREPTAAESRRRMRSMTPKA